MTKHWVDKPYHAGDVIMIVEPGNCYDRYDTWAQHHGISNWSVGNYCEKGMQGTVICAGPHGVIKPCDAPECQYQIVAVRLEDRNVLIGNEGIRLVQPQILEDELFEI